MSAALRRVVVIAANPAEMRPALGQMRGAKPHSHIAELKNLRGARVTGDQSQQRVDLAVRIANEHQLVLSQHRLGPRSLGATSLPRISCRRSLSNTHLPQAHSLRLSRSSEVDSFLPHIQSVAAACSFGMADAIRDSASEHINQKDSPVGDSPCLKEKTIACSIVSISASLSLPACSWPGSAQAIWFWRCRECEDGSS